MKYGYDAYGEMTSEIDARERTTNFTRDQLGWTLTGAIPLGTYGYTNYSSGQGKASGLTIRYAHATVVTRVRIYDNGKFIMNVMNPAHGGSSRLTNLRGAHNIFSVFR